MVGQLLTSLLLIISARQSDCNATLVVRTIPAGAVVLIDGKPAGNSPVVIDSLSCDRHALRVLPPVSVGWGGQGQDTTVLLQDGRNHVIVRLPGTLHLCSTPSGAIVFADGEVVGYTPLFLSRQTFRTCAIRMEARHYVSHRMVWMPRAGVLTRTAVTLLESASGETAKNGGGVGPLEVCIAGVTMAVASVISSREADKTYDRYLRTADPVKVEDLYNRAVRLDRWASALWVGFQTSIVAALVLWAAGR